MTVIRFAFFYQKQYVLFLDYLLQVFLQSILYMGHFLYQVSDY